MQDNLDHRDKYNMKREEPKNYCGTQRNKNIRGTEVLTVGISTKKKYDFIMFSENKKQLFAWQFCSNCQKGLLMAKYYDSRGNLSGFSDGSGRHYDRNGNMRGYSDSTGRHYNNSGVMTGYTDSTGRHYDRNGNLKGFTDSTGRRYDANGNLTSYRSRY